MPTPPPHASTPPKAGPGTAGILPAHLNPAEGGAWVRGRPARTFPQAAALPRRRGHRPLNNEPPPQPPA